MNFTKILLIVVVIGMFAAIGFALYDTYRSTQTNARETENQGLEEIQGFEAEAISPTFE